MPAVASIHPEHRIGVVTLRGTVRLEEILEAALLLYNDPDWQAGFGVLYDGRALETVLVHPGDAAAFSDLTRALYGVIGHGRTAWVYAREVDDLAARQIFGQIQAPARERQGFVAYDDAVAWLQARPRPGHTDGPLAGR